MYGDPMYKIAEIVGPDKIEIHVDVLDSDRFREKISNLVFKKEKLILTKRSRDGKEIKIHISNFDKNSSIKL